MVEAGQKVIAFARMPRTTLLIVDDEPNILTSLRRALEIEGYVVEVAGSGRVGFGSSARASGAAPAASSMSSSRLRRRPALAPKSCVP